jgi:hypothetical protein
MILNTQGKEKSKIYSKTTKILKMKKILLTGMLSTGTIVFGQIGMTTPNSRGALDINNNTTNTMGLILPTNTDVNNITTPDGSNVAAGTIIYDSTKDCVRFYRKTDQWSNCIKFSTDPVAKTTLKNLPDTSSTKSINIKTK